MSEPLNLERIKIHVEANALTAITRDEWTRLLAEVQALRDEITDRANVEADLRAQLAEEKAKITAITALADEYWGRATEGTRVRPTWRTVCRELRAGLEQR